RALAPYYRWWPEYFRPRRGVLQVPRRSEELPELQGVASLGERCEHGVGNRRRAAVLRETGSRCIELLHVSHRAPWQRRRTIRVATRNPRRLLQTHSAPGADSERIPQRFAAQHLYRR